MLAGPDSLRDEFSPLDQVRSDRRSLRSGSLRPLPALHQAVACHGVRTAHGLRQLAAPLALADANERCAQRIYADCSQRQSAQAGHLQTDELLASELGEATCVRYAFDSTATDLLLVPRSPFCKTISLALIHELVP